MQLVALLWRPQAAWTPDRGAGARGPRCWKLWRGWRAPDTQPRAWPRHVTSSTSCARVHGGGHTGQRCGGGEVYAPPSLLRGGKHALPSRTGVRAPPRHREPSLCPWKDQQKHPWKTLASGLAGTQRGPRRLRRLWASWFSLHGPLLPLKRDVDIPFHGCVGMKMTKTQAEFYAQSHPSF